MMGGWNTIAGYGWLGMGMMALFWVGVIALIIWAVRTFATPRHALTEPAALEIVQRRYARGEINHEAFEQMREALRSARGGTV